MKRFQTFFKTSSEALIILGTLLSALFIGLSIAFAATNLSSNPVSEAPFFVALFELVFSAFLLSRFFHKITSAVSKLNVTFGIIALVFWVLHFVSFFAIWIYINKVSISGTDLSHLLVRYAVLISSAPLIETMLFCFSQIKKQ